MSDKYFFSGCIMLGTLLLLFALSPWSDQLPKGAMSAANLDAGNLLVTNRDFNRFENGEIGNISLKEHSGTYMLEVGVKGTQAYDIPTFGPHLRLEADVEQSYAKQTLKITVSARQPASYKPKTPDQKMKFEMNYAANAAETSGWQVFELSPEFADYSFQYRPPSAGEGIGNDFLAIKPSFIDQAYKVEVHSVRFEILQVE